MKQMYSVNRMVFFTFLSLTAFLFTARAQTPVAVLENASGDTVLSSFADGGLLVPGVLNNGVIPAEGPGVRMLWYPAKAAFRAGIVSADQWNESKMGLFSSAFGVNTTASGFNSTAFGRDAMASGAYSTAFGRDVTASGQYSTAFGRDVTASGRYSTALGFGTVATTPSSLSIGRYNLSNNTDDETFLVIGNGISMSNLSDAFRVDRFGIVTATSFIAVSDRRLKENIQPLESNTLSKLANISPIRYTFKNQRTKPTGVQIGLIAQEVQAQFPELVTTDNNGYLSVSYGQFTAVLLKGLQEQQKELEEKDRQIRELQIKIQRLERFEARLARLEQLNHNAPPTDAE